MVEMDEKHIREVVRQVVERHVGAASEVRPSSAPPGPHAARRVAIGSDHGGFALKQVLIAFAGEELGWEVQDRCLRGLN